MLGARAKEAEVRIEDVFDPEEDVAKARLSHQYCQLFAVVGDTGSHCLDDVVNTVQLGLNDLPAQRLESLDVQSDVVVNQEDGPCALVVSVPDICNHAVEIVCMK